MQEQDTVQQFAETLLNMPIGQIETALARLDEKTREKVVAEMWKRYHIKVGE